MKNINNLWRLSIVALLFTSCGAYFNQPIDTQNARIGETTDATLRLRNLPLPMSKAFVGVYKVEDQTGQFKAADNGSSFSNAVTQGSTAILIKALEDSRWFSPIERENIDHLFTERNIIANTRTEFAKKTNTQVQDLDPLLYAGVIIEGAIVSYDTNVVTGGVGARYFGAGGSSKYRQDRVTVYLRVVSVKTGQIMKTVYVSKSIYSQAVDASLFRYVSFKRLLEAETGFTRNEPAQLAVKEAIEKGVEALVIEGIEAGLWYPKDGEAVANKLVADYHQEKEVAERTDVYQRELQERRSKWRVDAGAGGTFIRGDLPNAAVEYSLSTGIKYNISPHVGITGSVHKFRLTNTETFNREFAASELNLEVTLFPYEKLSPYIYGGAGLNHADFFDTNDLKVQAGLGIEYMASPVFGLKVYGDYSAVFSDDLDRTINGVRDDHYLKFGAGVNIYLGPNAAKSNNPKYAQRAELKRIKREEKALKRQLRKKEKQERKLSKETPDEIPATNTQNQ
ncbi:MAG: hypothetical protein NWQ19_04570 [Nonlabens sp.]|nr:hypothetical protein [Nonlabens sp.]